MTKRQRAALASPRTAADSWTIGNAIYLNRSVYSRISVDLFYGPPLWSVEVWIDSFELRPVRFWTPRQVARVEDEGIDLLYKVGQGEIVRFSGDTTLRFVRPLSREEGVLLEWNSRSLAPRALRAG